MNIRGKDESKIRLLVVVPELGNGGAERQAACLLGNVPRSEFDRSLGVFRGGGSYEEALPDEVEREVLGSRAWRSSTGSMMAAVPKLRALIRGWSPDVVCSFCEPGNVAAAAATAGMRGPPRVVMTVQGPHSEMETTGWGTRAMVQAARSAYRRADRVIALSHGVGQELLSRKEIDESRLRVIYNGVVSDDAGVQAGSPTGEGFRVPGRAIVVGCGRLVPEKGFAYLLEAMSRVQREVDAELWLLGTGPEQGGLERMAEELGISERVQFLGYKANPLGYMARGDVFVLSSDHEGFGNALVEAMSVGTPVIATDCPYGPREILGDSKFGLLVSRRDPVGLATAMNRVLCDEGLKAELGEAARARSADFRAGASAELYAEELRSLVPEKGAN